MDAARPRARVRRDPAPRARWWLRPGPRRTAGLVLAIVAVLILAALLLPVRYAYVPPPDRVLNPEQPQALPAYDLWGSPLTREEAARLAGPDAGAAARLEHRGAVAVTPELLRLGREAYYGETFGNEVWSTDVLGIVDGPLTLGAVTRALAALRGRGTGNLRVALARDALVGGQEFRKGQVVDTGLDVPRGAVVPLGMKVVHRGGRVRVGLTCAACHSSVAPGTFRVIHGAPNADLNAGLLLALAPNSAVYFTHADIRDLTPYVRDPARTVRAADGRWLPVPDPAALEEAVDATLLRWPPGSFDSTVDGQANPTQLPSAFTRGNHPYSWSGVFMAGPFRGLSAQTNNVHALNADTTTQADQSKALYGIDPEVFLAAILQNAPSRRFRWRPESSRRPSEVLARADPTPGVPGMNEVVVPPSYPKGTLLAPNGLLNSSPGYPVWRQVNAMAAWQESLVPPPAPIRAAAGTLRLGAEVFRRAGCVSCHSGPHRTDNRVLPVGEVGTEPSRAGAFRDTQKVAGPALLYPPDTPVPVPPGTAALPVPTGGLDPRQVRLAWAWDGSPGGYKVPALTGLYWTAPYLHDGGVAAGPDPGRQPGLPATLLRGAPADPEGSLRALVDRGQRRRVVSANTAQPRLRAMHVSGAGHDYWIDGPAGFTPAEQEAAIRYLLSDEPAPPTPPAAGRSGRRGERRPGD